MDYSKFIVSTQKEKSIRIQRVNVCEALSLLRDIKKLMFSASNASYKSEFQSLYLHFILSIKYSIHSYIQIRLLSL